MAELWQEGADPFHVDISVFHAGAMAQVDGELEHGETIFLQLLTEGGIRLPLLLGLGGKVEEHKNPHDAVLAEPFVERHHVSSSRDKRYDVLLPRSNDRARPLSG